MTTSRPAVEIVEPTQYIESLAGDAAESNPFQTRGYAAARSALGADPVVLRLEVDRQEGLGILAFAQTGRLRRTLEIPSFPQISRESRPLATEIERVLTEASFTDIRINSFASPPDLQIPRFRRELDRRPRVEFVLDLSAESALPNLAGNHKRNVKKATKAGARFLCENSEAACNSHVALMNSSLERRQRRGEVISTSGDLATCKALIAHGAGRIYQAQSETEILSSILVLRAPREAYYHSAGTTPKGMKMGASHFLIHEMARELGAEGVCVLNLGGADQHQSGLARFKAGFGAREIQLEAVRAIIGVRPKAMIVLALHRLQQIRTRLSG